MRKGAILAVVFLVQVFCIPSVITVHSFSQDTLIPQQIKILLEDGEMDRNAPTVEFLSPNDGDTLDYAPVTISYRVTNTSEIQNLYLIIDGKVREIAGTSSPYIWQANRQGEIILNLVCVDNLGRIGMAMITIRLIERKEISAFGILLAAIGLMATVGIGYKAISHPQYVIKKEETPTVEMIKVPFVYVIKSKLNSITKRKS